MREPVHTRPPGNVSIWIFALLLIVALPAAAQSSGEPPDGLPAGPWILTPYVVSGYETDDNIFRRNESSDPVDDRISTFTLGFGGYLPVRNSMLTFDYQLSQVDYETNQFTRDITHDANVAFQMIFSSYDRLTFRDTYSQSFSNLQNVDAGGELTFNGQPFTFNRWDIELTRQVPTRPGYTARISRTDLNYQGEENVPFFDYRGFEGALEYRQPVAGRRSLLVYTQARRFDHYEANSPATIGVPFRKEVSNQYLVGIQGLLGEDQAYLVRFGIGDFEYDLIQGTKFSGFVGLAQWRIPFGGRSAAEFTLNRSLLPSNFDTYYVNTELRASMERVLGRLATGGIRVLASENSYGDIVEITGCQLVARKDERIQVQPWAQFMVHPRLAFLVQGEFEDRTSNCEAVEYKYTSFNVGLTFGWF